MPRTDSPPENGTWQHFSLDFPPATPHFPDKFVPTQTRTPEKEAFTMDRTQTSPFSDQTLSGARGERAHAAEARDVVTPDLICTWPAECTPGPVGAGYVKRNQRVLSTFSGHTGTHPTGVWDKHGKPTECNLIASDGAAASSNKILCAIERARFLASLYGQVWCDA